MKTLLFLDDTRRPPSGWTLAKTYEEAIAILKTGTCALASLDHDLELSAYGSNPSQYKGKTGYDVCLWLEKHPEYWPKGGCQVHSANAVGRARMLNIIRRHYQRSMQVNVYGPHERQESHLPTLQATLCFSDSVPGPPPSVIL